MVPVWRVLAFMVVLMGGMQAAVAFDGSEPASQPDSQKALDIFKNPRQALLAALEGYQNGGSAASSLEALKYAAAGGESLARWKLGRMYAEGDGVPHDDYKAYQYFEDIVDHYDEDSMNWRERAVVSSAFVAVGVFNLTGIQGSRLHPNLARAMDMFLYAATNFGDANAQYNLARMHMDGVMGEKDNIAAVRWFGLAAEKGHVESQALLGHLLFGGNGVYVQRARGLMWLTIAHEKANAKDQEWIETLYQQDLKAANDNDRQAALTYVEDRQRHKN